MKATLNEKFVGWIKALLIVIVLLLPARCFNGYYLRMFETDSNISVQYVNLVDMAILCTTVVFIIGKRKVLIDKTTSKAAGVYIIANGIMLIPLIISGHSDYVGELLSKSLIIICAAVLVNQIRFLDKQTQIYIWILPLVALVGASFFLSGYKGYASMNRVGSLGFGTNETAGFACALLAICLFVKTINIWFRLGGTVLSLACVLNVASRRGMVVAIAVFAVWGLILLWKKHDSKISIRSFLTSAVIIIGLCVVIYMKLEQIVNYVNSSPLIVRFRFALQYNNEIMDYSDRIGIFRNIFDYIDKHLLFGSCGCDKVLAQGSISHAHNVLLQFIATYGLLIGILFSVYYIVTFFRSLILMKQYYKEESFYTGAAISLFFIINFVFESFGYMFWNPKALFWIALSMFMINMEYQEIKQSSTVDDVEEARG